MRLLEIAPPDYAREVLPLTASLWAGRRDMKRYVTQTLEIAACGYGRRNYRTLGLYDGTHLVASFKRYQRTLRWRQRRLRGVGIGAVFTPDAFRGRGYASAMLAMLLDRSRNEGDDFAYLFSDIRPHFYEELGFTPLPSRAISLRADTLAGKRIEVARILEADWSGVRRCFDLSERTRPWALVRTPLVWEWMRLRIRHGSEHPTGVETNLAVHRGRSIAAYILGVRAPEHDAYLLDEFGFADDEAAGLLPALLRAAAGDLRRIVGWLPPDGARDLLPRGSVRKRRDAIFMAAPLSAPAKTWLAAAAAPSAADGIWSTDHV
ncbi:MAG: GNAT family N-acetyltransferase [Vulcanimicrobiaceae bacterium]